MKHEIKIRQHGCTGAWQLVIDGKYIANFTSKGAAQAGAEVEVRRLDKKTSQGS